jgi:hypothetical protein
MPTVSPDAAPVTLPFSLHLPADWITMTLDAGAAAGQLAADAPAFLRERAGDLLIDGPVDVLLAAWPQDGANLAESELGLVVVALPVDDLRLPTVVSATVASLARTPEILVSSAAVISGLRAGGEPVGEIDYLMGAAPHPISGKQIIIHDIDARRLVVLTFSGPAEKMEEFAPQIAETVAEIVGSVSIVDAP